MAASPSRSISRFLCAAALIGSLCAQAMDLRDRIAGQLPKDVQEGSGNPSIRLFTLVELAFRPKEARSLLVPAAMTEGARNSAGPGAPSMILFLPSPLGSPAAQAIALRQLQFRIENPPTYKACSGADFAECCVESPYVACISSPQFLSDLLPMLRRPTVALAVADTMAAEIGPKARQVVVAGLGPHQLPSNRLLLAAGYVPSTNEQRFIAVELTGKLLESIAFVSQSTEPLYAAESKASRKASSAYVCSGGRWHATTRLPENGVQIGSNATMNVRGATGHQSLSIGADSGNLVIAIASRAVTAGKSFFDLVQSVPIQSALTNCFGKDFSVGTTNPGLLNLLRNEEVSLLLGYAMFLGAFWETAGTTFQ